MQNLALLFQSGGLKLHPEMPDAQSLLFELAAIGHDASSSGPHDDLAMATALAAWRAAFANRRYLKSSAL